MLELKNITKVYEVGTFKQKALDDVSISFRKGEFVSILGPSGSGKTTMLNIIGGLDRYTSGDLIINGKSTKHFKDVDWDSYRNNSIGFVFQNYNLINHISVLGNVELALTLSGVGMREKREKAIAALERVGLSHHIHKRPNQLSGGQKQRVAIARALANNPKILLSDEATSALDPQTTKSILDLLSRIRDELGLTIIMITHQIEVVKDICDRVAIMENGEIVEISTVEELFKRPKSKTARAFINSLSSDIQEEFIKPAEFKGRILRLSFWGDIVKKPIVSHMVKRFDIDVNILSGNISQLMSTSAGHLIVELTGSDEEIQAAIDYLKAHDVEVEVM